MSDMDTCDNPKCEEPTRLGHVLCDACAQDRLEDDAADAGWGQ